MWLSCDKNSNKTSKSAEGFWKNCTNGWTQFIDLIKSELWITMTSSLEWTKHRQCEQNLLSTIKGKSSQVRCEDKVGDFVLWKLSWSLALWRSKKSEKGKKEREASAREQKRWVCCPVCQGTHVRMTLCGHDGDMQEGESTLDVMRGGHLVQTSVSLC